MAKPKPTYNPPQDQYEDTAPDQADEEVVDGRDVWEKMADYLPFAGMVAGGFLGSRVGAKKGSKLYKKHEGLQNKIRKLEAKGRNPNQGVTAKERTDLDKARGDAEHTLSEWGGNLALRSLTSGGGAVVGNTIGSAGRDAVNSRKRK